MGRTSAQSCDCRSARQNIKMRRECTGKKASGRLRRMQSAIPRTGSNRAARTLFLAATATLSLWLNACTMGQLVAHGSRPLLEGGLIAMNRETDLELAKTAIPGNLNMIEGLIVEDPDNLALKVYAASGFYDYAYGFVEDDDPARASKLYERGFEYGRSALAQGGLPVDLERASLDELTRALTHTTKKSVPELFWTAMCWAKWIDLNRTDPALLANAGKAVALMQRVLDLDDTYFYGGAHLFFGVYYGGRSPMLGGNPKLSARHFRKAREISQGKLLLVDLLEAQYLDRQIGDRHAFHEELTRVIDAPVDLYPDMALMNKIAQQKARALLSKEGDLF